MNEIDTMMPGICPEEKELRSKLLRARTVATQELIDCEPGSQSHRLFYMVCEIATAWVYQPMDMAILIKTVEHCRRMFSSGTDARELGL